MNAGRHRDSIYQGVGRSALEIIIIITLAKDKAAGVARKQIGT